MKFSQNKIVFEKYLNLYFTCISLFKFFTKTFTVRPSMRLGDHSANQEASEVNLRAHGCSAPLPSRHGLPGNTILWRHMRVGGKTGVGRLPSIPCSFDPESPSRTYNFLRSHHYFLFRTTTFDSSGQNFFFNDILRAFKVWFSKVQPRHAKKHNSNHFLNST